MVVPFLFLFPRFLPVLLLHLVLEEAAKHVLFLIHPHHSLLLLFVHPLLVTLDLLPLKLCPLRLSLPVADCRLVLVDALQFLLVFYEMVVVLFVDGILLGFNLAADHHLFVVLLFLPLLLLSFSCLYLLLHCQLLEGDALLLFHDLLLAEVFLLNGPAVVFVHLPFLLNDPPPLLLRPPSLLLAQLQVLRAQFVLEFVFMRPLLGDLSLQQLVVPHYLLEFSAFVLQGEVARRQFLQQGVVVVVSECHAGYLTILLLRRRISALFS